MAFFPIENNKRHYFIPKYSMILSKYYFDLIEEVDVEQSRQMAKRISAAGILYLCRNPEDRP